ncbi:MAG TPA: 3-hydroxyacyl-CoA dehydrogenase NAD-binding domain-containing protein [Catalimonadaceae bacterium]|nr:3-hydroxyacyl-CoA dehydrogenase NAD-binding domain-containing protein [Catalimonadaceae bacterium]
MMKVGVIGSGTMGIGIAQVAATAGCEVLIFDANSEALQNSKKKLSSVFSSLVEKGKLDHTKSLEIQSRLHFVDGLEKYSGCDLVIEAIIERREIKAKLFQDLEQFVSDSCILASNTSSLSIASLAASCQKPNRFIGIHFFNPAPLMALVEIIPAVQTAENVVIEATKIIKGWGKTTVLAKDTPGFIVNRVARPFYGEALRIYDEGIADMATIDWAMKTLGGFKMGPFELMDFIGNDINYTVTETVFHSFFYDPKYMPSFTQKRMMEAGYLGRKSGKGFYDYNSEAKKPASTEDHELAKIIFYRILVMLINEAAEALHYGIASREDIDLAMTKAVNYPKGLLAWGDELGWKTVVHQLDHFFEVYHDSRYRCSSIIRKWAQT